MPLMCVKSFRMIKILLLVVIAICSPIALAVESQSKGENRTADVCAVLMQPHLALTRVLPQISDEEALQLLKANYSELVTWLTQKTDSTPEGGAKPVGVLGPEKNQTPSMYLFGKEIVEVNRTAVGFLALKWILANDYESFTGNQIPAVRLSKESFADLRNYVMATLKTSEDIDAMIVMILTNDLGKVKKYHDLTERAAARAVVDHDEVLFVGFSEWPETSPNFLRLPEKQKEWILDGLKMGSGLNIGQFAQAENVPASLSGVKVLAGKSDAFDFKFVELLLDVAGASGHVKPGGAATMIEPVFKGFMLSRQALQEVIAGHSVREAYDQILINKNRVLVAAGFRSLDVSLPEDRALLRLLTLRRAVSAKEAEEVDVAFKELPTNAKAILITELNKDGTDDGWATLAYYAPAFIVNAVGTLSKTSAGPIKALQTTFLALARVFQESRIILKGRPSNGVLTVNIKALADYVAAPKEAGQITAYMQDPNSLLNQQYEFFRHGDDETQYGIRLSSYGSTNSSRFGAPSRKSMIDEVPGKSVAVLGIGGGSDGVQAAQLALILRTSGKDVKFVGSVRTEKTGSQGADGKLGQNRTITDHGGEIVKGVFKVLPNSKGSGRFLENIPADKISMHLIVDRQDGALHSQIQDLIDRVGGVDTLIAVDTGGDALYPADHDPQSQGKATPDQDLRVLQSLTGLSVKNLRTAIVAAGVDSPVNAEEVLYKANANYYILSPTEVAEVLARYNEWGMDGSDETRYGKTPLAWQLALRGQTGLQVMSLPTHVVIDQNNPWNPFIYITDTMSGIFFMHLDAHLDAITKH